MIVEEGSVAGEGDSTGLDSDTILVRVDVGISAVCVSAVLESSLPSAFTKKVAAVVSYIRSKAASKKQCDEGAVALLPLLLMEGNEIVNVRGIEIGSGTDSLRKWNFSQIPGFPWKVQMFRLAPAAARE